MPTEEVADDATIYPLRDIEKPAGPEPTTGGWQKGVPIAIDLGTYQTRVGYAFESEPTHVFYTQMSKYKERKGIRTYTLVGNDVCVDPMARQQAKSPFDGPLLSNWEAVETILDYSFTKISVQSRNGVDNPVVMTELVGAPLPQRKSLNELLFEGYNVPSAAYGIDSLFSFRYNNKNTDGTGLVVSCANEATHIIPVVQGRGILSQSKRINWGGRQAASYLQSLLGLKYPLFPTKISQSQTMLLVQDHCYVSKSYSEEVSSFLEYDGLADRERVIEAPYVETVVVEKTEEELARIAEQRKESGRRLQEQAAQKRLEKLIQRENELEYYKGVQDQLTTATKKDLKRILEREGFRDEAMLQKTISELDKAIRKARKQDVGEDDEHTEAPSFPLVDIPDEELDEEQIKEKRKQRLLKANYDARMRAKEEKLLEQQRAEQDAQRDADWRARDLEGWIKDRRGKLETMLANGREKRRLKEELSNRKSLASQMRMKNIAALASESKGSKRRRPGETEYEDTFGANDEDWAIYRSIANASDSEEEGEEQRLMKTLQDELLEHDPNFSIEDTHEAKSDWRKSTIHMFLRGPHEFDPQSQAHVHQFNLNIERIRIPEVLFQPSIAGVDQAGIVEIAGDMLLRNQERSFAENVLLTGGQALFENFQNRMTRELTSVLPVGTRLHVRRAADPMLDAWKGMANWSTSDEFATCAVTRQEYLEMGSEYMKEHGVGNAFVG
jgi:actin-related protein 5